MPDDFHIYMDHAQLQKFRTFCNRIDEGSLVYAMYPRVSGPIVGADKKTQVTFSFRHKFVAVEPTQDYSYGWAFAITQEVCRHLDVKEVLYKDCTYTPEEFISKHPYTVKIEMHRRILEATKLNVNAPLSPHHEAQIRLLNDLYRKFRVAASRLWAGTTNQAGVNQPIEAEVVT